MRPNMASSGNGVQISGPVSIGNIHDPTDSPTPTISPPSHADIGDLGDDYEPLDFSNDFFKGYLQGIQHKIELNAADDFGNDGLEDDEEDFDDDDAWPRNEFLPEEYDPAQYPPTEFGSADGQSVGQESHAVPESVDRFTAAPALGVRPQMVTERSSTGPPSPHRWAPKA